MITQFNIAAAGKIRARGTDERMTFVAALIMKIAALTTSCQETATAEQKAVIISLLTSTNKAGKLVGLQKLVELVRSQEQDCFGSNLSTEIIEDGKFEFSWYGTIKPNRFFKCCISVINDGLVSIEMEWDTATKEHSTFLNLPEGLVEAFDIGTVDCQTNGNWFAIWGPARNLKDEEVRGILRSLDIVPSTEDLDVSISRSSSSRVSDAEHHAFLKRVLIECKGNPFHREVKEIFWDNPYYKNGRNSQEDMETGWKNFLLFRKAFYR